MNLLLSACFVGCLLSTLLCVSLWMNVTTGSWSWKVLPIAGLIATLQFGLVWELFPSSQGRIQIKRLRILASGSACGAMMPPVSVGLYLATGLAAQGSQSELIGILRFLASIALPA